MSTISKESRTAKSIKNSVVALSYFGIDLCLKFFSRSIFIKVLGDEILGLNSTIMNLLQFLNLAELGIGAAVGFSLYKPIANKDTQTINEIIQLNGHLYKRIALLVLIGSFILMCFFPLIFKKTNLPLWYAYVTFLVFLTGLLLNYSVNYRQILLSAAQMDFKIQYSYKSCQIIKTVIQIIVVEYLPYPYIAWLVTEEIFAIISALALDLMVKKTFPYLERKQESYIKLKLKYKSINTKIKQIFFHKICGFIVTQTSPLIIYGYLSLSVVTLYTNYLVITSGITQLLNAVFNSMTNSIGNLVAEGNIKKILSVFYEMFSLRFYIVSICCFGLFVLSKPFITLWLGSEYILPQSSLCIIIAILYISLTRTTVDAFLNAYGMFQDIVAPICESIINLGMSIILGAYFGLNGILCGTLISLIMVVFSWKPYFLFKNAFKTNFFKYIGCYIQHILIFILSYIGWFVIQHKLNLNFNVDNWVSFIKITMYSMTIFVLCFSSLMVICRMPILKTMNRFRR